MLKHYHDYNNLFNWDIGIHIAKEINIARSEIFICYNI